MNIFSDMEKALTQAGKTVVNKTKDYNEVTKLNSTINAETGKINLNYQNIGKLYCSIHADDFEEDFAEYISAIKNSETAIADCRQQIMSIKGLMNCKECGAEIPKDSAVCPSCKAQLITPSVPSAPLAPSAQPVQSGTVNCPSCGKALADNMKFCTVCGTAIVTAQSEAEPSVSITEENSTTEADASVCKNCGEALEPDSLFCTKCGQRI